MKLVGDEFDLTEALIGAGTLIALQPIVVGQLKAAAIEFVQYSVAKCVA